MATVREPVALITGSGKKRVGHHVADALARRGHHIVVHYNRSDAEAQQTAAQLRTHGVRVEIAQADLATAAGARGLVEQTLGHFGRIDVLVTCASIWEPKRLEEIDAADLKRHFDINVGGTFFCAQQAGLAMVRQPDGGCIVLFGDWAVRRPYLDYAAYFAGKGAIPTLTRCLAVELGTRNPRVRVNCVEPGPAMVPDAVSPAERAAIADATLVKREGRPEHLAQAVISFVDNDFITGACLTVDGGRSVYAGGL